MKHIERLGSQFSISIPAGEDGLVGRECPDTECESYFKIQPGTGLKGDGLPCHCPYCGHEAGQDKFFTKAQIEYAKSIVLSQVAGALLKDLKTLEFNHQPRGGFGIGISMKVTGQPTPIRHYREKQLETEVVCDKCTLRYMIYGVFGFCPDCGIHNSLQILGKNLELVDKMLAVAEVQEHAVAQVLIENALEDCVSSFDGFGRETCRVFSSRATTPEKAAEIRFQNIASARQRVREHFSVDFAIGLNDSEWALVLRCFQKRHLLAHKMGVVDEEYIQATSDHTAVLGRKSQVDSTEVRALVAALHTLGKQLSESLRNKS
ncbi:MAG: hypothetical protein ACYC3A_10330 [Halothiobacillus sp.]